MKIKQILDVTQARLRRQSGAFDLPSIMIGVAVVAILTLGVLAAIFGVIPWSQDKAAQQDLAAVNTAQGAAYAKDGDFLNRDGIISAGWLSNDIPDPLKIDASADGECYVAVQPSDTGRAFIASSGQPTPRELTNADTWCNGEVIDADAVEAPADGLEEVESTNPPVAEVASTMVTTWDTSLAQNCKSIQLPIYGYVDVTVDWGDGSAPQKSLSSSTHVYMEPYGEVTIVIDGTFQTWGGDPDGWSDANCLVSVDKWGDTKTSSLYGAFAKANNLTHVEAIPSTTVNLASAFRRSTANPTLGNWDTSNVTLMMSMFDGALAFNQPVDFDTAKVDNMSFMFKGATAFNQPIDFNTEKVTNVAFMFQNATSFNQDLKDLTVTHVTNHGQFDSGATSWTLPRPNFL